MVTLFGTIAVLYFAREILIPLAFALILTFVLTPVVALLERSRIGRVPSVAVTVLVTIAAAGCIAGIIAIQLVNAAQELPRYRQNIQAKMAALRIPTTGPFGLAANSVKEIAREFSSPAAPSPEPAPPRRRIGSSALRRVHFLGLLCLYRSCHSRPTDWTTFAIWPSTFSGLWD
jgi:HAMP domain-containing protein